MNAPPARGLLWGWSLLAVLALALAGVFAILLVLARAPVTSDAITWPVAFFKKALVVHVVLSFVVWYLAVMGALVELRADGRGRTAGPRSLGPWGLGLAAAGTVLLLLPAALDRGEPTLNNYIPMIIDPLYYAGLVFLGAGVLVQTARLFPGLAGAARSGEAPDLALAAAGLLYVAAMAGFAFAAVELSGEDPSHDFNERLVWGGGHLLQFVNLALLFAAWGHLGRHCLDDPLAGAGLARLALALLLLGGLAGLALFALFPMGEDAHFTAFTELQYALFPPAALLGAGAGAVLWKRRRDLPWGDPVFEALAGAFGVLAVGGAFGFFVDGQDTRTPAHYHGVIGGINLAFVGLFYGVILPRLGRPVTLGRAVRAQVRLYALGQLLFSVGMFMAGGLGAARKVMGAGISMDNASALAAVGIRDLGGALSVIGGVMFIWIALAALFKRG